MFEYAVNYFWLERKLDSLIGRISDRLSEGTDLIRVLVLCSFLISRSCFLGHIHVDTFALLCMKCPCTSEMITNVGSLLTYISNSLTLILILTLTLTPSPSPSPLYRIRKSRIPAFRISMGCGI